jgi:hypothetical protein
MVIGRDRQIDLPDLGVVARMSVPRNEGQACYLCRQHALSQFTAVWLFWRLANSDADFSRTDSRLYPFKFSIPLYHHQFQRGSNSLGLFQLNVIRAVCTSVTCLNCGPHNGI